MTTAILLLLTIGQPHRLDAIKANTEAIRVKPKAVKEDAYAVAYRNAIATRKPLLVFVSSTPRDVPGCVSTAVPSMNGSDRPRVIVMTDADAISPVLEPTATDAEILRAAGRQVSLPAYPFDRRPEPPTADDSGPWLPVGGRSKRNKGLQYRPVEAHKRSWACIAIHEGR